MLIKGVAVAVDLCLTVGASALLFYLLSNAVPLDDPAARVPVWMVLAVALGYLVFGRDHVYSPGRRIMRLTLVRLPGSVPGLYGRSISVHVDEKPGKGNEQLTRAMLVIALASLLAALSLAGALTTTHLYTTVRAHLLAGRPVAGLAAPVDRLATLPRALLMNRQRGYVQLDAHTVDGTVLVEVFATRVGRGWSVTAARRSREAQFANYSLGVRDEDMPAAPAGQ